jgi:hypothetical protein
MIMTLKLHRNFNDTWRAKLTVDKATEEKLESYRSGLEKSNIRRKSKPRRRRGKKKADNSSVSSAS